MKKERINEAYRYLLSNGIVHTQKELAVFLNASKSQICRALAGDPTYLTDSLLRRIAFRFGLNVEYLIEGKGTLKNDNTVVDIPETEDEDTITFLKRQVEWLKKQIAEKEKAFLELSLSYKILNDKYIEHLQNEKK